MRITQSALAGAALAVTLLGPAAAQSQVEWKQTVNIPKGQNLPQGAAVDILGIAPGDTYEEVKAKLERIRAEKAEHQMLSEKRTQMRLQTPGGHIVVSYVSGFVFERDLTGSGGRVIKEYLNVFLTAPSSGQQVIGIVRRLIYNAQTDQPRVSELLGQVAEKLKATPHRVSGSFGSYRVQYDNGRVVAPPPNATWLTCQAQYGMSAESGIRDINPKGDCDVVFETKISPGISEDHAKEVEFILSDNERTKANLTADFAFLGNYARGLTNSKGAAPKL